MLIYVNCVYMPFLKKDIINIYCWAKIMLIFSNYKLDLPANLSP